MNIKVTRTKVIIDSGYIVNRQEYKVNPCEFEFSEEYTQDLVKKAIFITDGIEIEKAIINNQCDIPYDVLDSKMFELHVYAYEVVNDELVLRYSPTYAKVFLREGSYRGTTGSGEVIEPTQFEQYEQALNDGLNEMDAKLQEVDTALQEVDNVDIDISKVGDTATVEITNRDGVIKSVEIEDGTDYVITEQDYQAIADIVEGDIQVDVPTKVSELQNDVGYITKEVNNLTNYYKKNETYTKTEIDNKIVAVYKYKGSVARYIDLPSTGQIIGDVYNVEADGSNYAWNGTTWDKLGGDVDLSNYYTKTQTDNLLSGKADTSDIPDLTDYVKNTDYATSSTGGVIKVNTYNNAIALNNSGELYAVPVTYEVYTARGNGQFVSKGTLENVLNARIGDIETILETLDTGSGV